MIYSAFKRRKTKIYKVSMNMIGGKQKSLLVIDFCLLTFHLFFSERNVDIPADSRTKVSPPYLLVFNKRV